MIGRITGTLIELSPPMICVQAAGLGYELDLPMSSIYQLPAIGEQISLFTHLVVREDAHVLFGFISAAERSAFRALTKVSGVGARTALAVLSGLSVQDLAQAIQNQESARLLKIPGIGKKTAERLLLELRDKPLGGASASAPVPGAAAPSAGAEVLQALLALGYSNNEAQRAIDALPEGLDITQSIRQALKSLSRS